MTKSADPEPSIPYLWEVLRYYIEHACNMFGLPADIANRLWFTRSERAIFISWLRPLEALLRRLVLIDALAYTAPPIAERKHRFTATLPSAAGATFNPDASETWRAPFNLGVAAEQAARRANHTPAARAPGLPNAFASAPLALRLEALIRGFNQPEPLAKRLARLLSRAPRRLDPFIRALPRRRCSGLGWHSVAQAVRLLRAALLPDPVPDTS